MADEEQQQMQEPMEDEDVAVPVVIDRSKLTPNMRHYLAMSKLHSQNEYSKGLYGNLFSSGTLLDHQSVMYALIS